jgi:hypothetical protein
MLGIDYSERLESLMREVVWDIELPATMERFFQQSGPTNGVWGDQRRASRLLVRTRCLLIAQSNLPAIKREP